jgi:hypothetical protein
MEPLRTARGEAAALRAATESQGMSSSDRNLSGGQNAGGSAANQHSDTKFIELLEYVLCLPLTPFFWLGEWFVNAVGKPIYRLGAKAYANTRRQGQLFLNGMKPYSFSIRITAVNLLVLCSAWYMFIDQARLAFFPPSSDDAVTIVSL